MKVKLQELIASYEKKVIADDQMLNEISDLIANKKFLGEPLNDLLSYSNVIKAMRLIRVETICDLKALLDDKKGE